MVCGTRQVWDLNLCPLQEQQVLSTTKLFSLLSLGCLGAAPHQMGKEEVEPSSMVLGVFHWDVHAPMHTG